MGTEQEPVRVYGPETWGTVAGRDWSWWDLWFCLIAVKDHGGHHGFRKSGESRIHRYGKTQQYRQFSSIGAPQRR